MDPIAVTVYLDVDMIVPGTGVPEVQPTSEEDEAVFKIKSAARVSITGLAITPRLTTPNKPISRPIFSVSEDAVLTLTGVTIASETTQDASQYHNPNGYRYHLLHSSLSSSTLDTFLLN